MSTNEYILAIESSCDDTAAAVLHNDKLLANVVADQKLHEQYGGVVPELASREHQKNIVPVVHEALRQSGIDKQDLTKIAYTKGPGLLGSLMVGASFARSMARALGIDSVGINHMKGHILAHFIKDEDERPLPQFPFLSLTVSGGHTQVVEVESPTDMKIIGSTIDDAAGEAFDKCSRMLGLPYPGGPHMDKLAKKGEIKFEFAEPNVPGLDFSFSGLKTSVLYFLRNQKKTNHTFIEENLEDLCASIQAAIVNILIKKLSKALEKGEYKGLALAGGVAANSELRERIEKLGRERGIPTHIPPFSYCTDNAAMIGIAAYYGGVERDSSSDKAPQANLKFD